MGQDLSTVTMPSPEAPCAVDRTQEISAGRSACEVLAATRPFTVENRWKSWWYLSTTVIMLIGLLTIAGMAPWWPARLLCSMLAALVMVRVFIIYHDFMHGSMLRDSLLAKILLHLYGYLALAPARTWRKSHNFHHAHVGKALVVNSGSYPIMTTDMWQQASVSERINYRISRNPLIILLAYPMVFGWSLTIEPLLEERLRKWDSALALALHGALIAVLWWWGGPSLAVFTVIVPVAMAATIGAYLFYAQHNFPGMKILTDDEWTNYRASLETSSFITFGPLMRWITGDIGYHHVHHLNLAIPFYRLAEAMAAIPELQHPVTTTMSLRDILACLRLKVWDRGSRSMVGYHGAE
jgi:omega-6 fatty acid desaturase (delta-12 desaturase)